MTDTKTHADTYYGWKDKARDAEKRAEGLERTLARRAENYVTMKDELNGKLEEAHREADVLVKENAELKRICHERNVSVELLVAERDNLAFKLADLKRDGAPNVGSNASVAALTGERDALRAKLDEALSQLQKAMHEEAVVTANMDKLRESRNREVDALKEQRDANERAILSLREQLDEAQCCLSLNATWKAGAEANIARLQASNELAEKELEALQLERAAQHREDADRFETLRDEIAALKLERLHNEVDADVSKMESESLSESLTTADVETALIRIRKLARDACFRAPEVMRPLQQEAATSVNVLASYFGLVHWGAPEVEGMSGLMGKATWTQHTEPFPPDAQVMFATADALMDCHQLLDNLAKWARALFPRELSEPLVRAEVALRYGTLTPDEMRQACRLMGIEWKAELTSLDVLVELRRAGLQLVARSK